MTAARVLELRGRADDPAAARHFARDHLYGVPDDVCADALVIVSELVTNVYLHGGTPANLTLQVSGRLVRIEVHDSGPDITVRPGGLPLPTGGGGRGLYIVAALAKSWGVRTTHDRPGKTVWTELAG